ncbi:MULTISPECIES: hypothetical protein [Moraxella]|nr:hypothetical protein [Moraxella sp. ZY171148]
MNMMIIKSSEFRLRCVNADHRLGGSVIKIVGILNPRFLLMLQV